MMKVILLENIKGVGKKDQILEASDGYARNFLFPRKLALEANKENLAKLQAKQNSVQFKKEIEKEQAQGIAKKLKEMTLVIEVKAGENGKIFGGVTAKEIAEQLKTNHQIEIDKKKILLEETIKTLGTTTVTIKLYEGVTANLKIQVKTKA